jgi:Glycosyl transferase family 11
MIITRLAGGLGNQMFQYAAARAYSLRTGHDFAVDLLDVQLNKDRNYELEHLNCCPKKVGVWHRVRNNGIIVDERVTTPEHFTSMTLDHLDMIGYWQDERYFRDYEKQIRNDFTLYEKQIRHDFTLYDALDDENNAAMLQQIRACENPVSVHIRRGDYVGNPVHPVMEPDYYLAAMNKIELDIENPTYFIFSDECQPMLFRRNNIHDVTINDPNHGYFDLELMKNCKHHIIANSSFSWWGAWLGNNPERVVVAPKQWFSSGEHRIALPERWVRI